MIDHLFARHVQGQLVAPFGFAAAGNVEAPVGVLFVELAFPRDHFRLEPEAEFEAERVDLLHQGAEAALEFGFVDEPVAEAGVVVVAFAEPAVVEHEHFDAESCGVSGDGEQFLFVEIEIGGFPVVDENRALAVLPVAPDQVIVEEIVEGAAHFADAAA